MWVSKYRYIAAFLICVAVLAVSALAVYLGASKSPREVVGVVEDKWLQTEDGEQLRMSNPSLFKIQPATRAFISLESEDYQVIRSDWDNIQIGEEYRFIQNGSKTYLKVVSE